MASKRSRHGQPVALRGDERDFNHGRLKQAPESSKNRVQLYDGADLGRDQPILQWRAARIERFIKIQKCKREWINFCEISEWCSDESGVVPDEGAREAAYRKLQRDLLEGDFEENGRSRVLYLFPYSSKARMAGDWLTHMMEIYDQTTINSTYLAPCWIPREFFERWLAKHRMQSSPPRFQPKCLASCVSGPTRPASQ